MMTISLRTHRAARTMIGGVGLAAVAVLTSCGADSAGSDAPVVVIELGRYTISPNDLTIAAGPVALQVTNVDTMPHNLVVAGKGTRNLAPGATQTIEAEIAVGDYRMWCDVQGHAGLGQVGALRVAAADPTATSGL